MAFFQTYHEKINKDSDTYKQGFADAKSEMSEQVVSLQNQLQDANNKILAAQAASGNKASGNPSRDAVLADRRRIQRLMASNVAQYRQEAALKLACETDMDLDQVRSILNAMPENRPDRPGLSEFEKMMAKEVGLVNIGAGSDYDGGRGDGDYPGATDEQLVAAVIAANNLAKGTTNQAGDDNG